MTKSHISSGLGHPVVAFVSTTVSESAVGNKYLLKDGNDRRLPLLQEVKHHQDVGIGGQASSGSIADVAALQKHQLG